MRIAALLDLLCRGKAEMGTSLASYLGLPEQPKRSRPTKEGGLWPDGESELVKKTRRGEFMLMILRPEIKPADLARAVKERYVSVDMIDLRGTLGNWPAMIVYVPKDKVWRPATLGTPPRRRER